MVGWKKPKRSHDSRKSSVIKKVIWNFPVNGDLMRVALVQRRGGAKVQAFLAHQKNSINMTRTVQWNLKLIYFPHGPAFQRSECGIDLSKQTISQCVGLSQLFSRAMTSAQNKNKSQSRVTVPRSTKQPTSQPQIHEYVNKQMLITRPKGDWTSEPNKGGGGRRRRWRFWNVEFTLANCSRPDCHIWILVERTQTGDSIRMIGNIFSSHHHHHHQGVKVSKLLKKPKRTFSQVVSVFGLSVH